MRSELFDGLVNVYCAPNEQRDKHNNPWNRTMEAQRNNQHKELKWKQKIGIFQPHKFIFCIPMVHIYMKKNECFAKIINSIVCHGCISSEKVENIKNNFFCV